MILCCTRINQLRPTPNCDPATALPSQPITPRPGVRTSATGHPHPRHAPPPGTGRDEEGPPAGDQSQRPAAQRHRRSGGRRQRRALYVCASVVARARPRARKHTQRASVPQMNVLAGRRPPHRHLGTAGQRVCSTRSRRRCPRGVGAAYDVLAIVREAWREANARGSVGLACAPAAGRQQVRGRAHRQAERLAQRARPRRAHRLRHQTRAPPSPPSIPHRKGPLCAALEPGTNPLAQVAGMV